MKHLFTTFLFFLTLTMLAQPYGPGNGSPKDGVIRGKVIDKDLDQALEFSNVAIYSVRDSSLVSGNIADENGVFKVEELPFGKFYAEVNFIGYEKTVITDIKIFPQQKDIDLGVIALSSASTVLEDVVVTAERAQVEYRIDRKVVNVSSNLNAATGNAVDVLETVPSIQVDVEGNVLLRGSGNFTVFVDGKPTVLEPTDALEQIPAGTIQDIEIITNPSAKYDPDGVGGIINVVLKKKKKSGSSGVINGTVGTNDKYRTDFTYSLRKGKFDFQIGADYQDRKFFGVNESVRESILNDTLTTLDAVGDGFFNREGKSVKLGMGYRLNDNNSFNITANLGEYAFGIKRTSLQTETIDPPGTVTLFDNLAGFRREGNYYSVDFSWDLKFENGGDLVTYLFYSGRDGGNNSIQEAIDIDESGNIIGDDVFLTNIQETSESDQFRFKLDYTKKYEKGGVFEAGYQWRRNTDVEDYEFYQKDDPSEDFPELPEFTNSTDFIRNIHGGYFTYSGKLSSFEYKFGLRSEYTDRRLQNVQSNTESVIDRIDYFPSFYVGKKIKETNQLYASYSRRINRPRGWYLDPFPYFRDQFTIRIGNPDLEPEYIDSYELGFSKEIKQSFLSVEAYYRITNNMITRIQTLDDDGIFVNTFENINRDFALGAELSFNLMPVKWLSMNFSGNLYNYRIEGRLEEGQSEESSTNVDGRINVSLRAGKNTRFQLNSIIRGPSVTPQGERDGMWGLNVSARQDFFNKKFSATLQMRDIFDTMNFGFTQNGSNFTTRNFSDRESQIVLLSVSYKINNYRPDRRRRDRVELEGGGF